MSFIAVFPGQGAQFPGMGKSLYQQIPEARDVFLEVDEALGEKFSMLVFEGSEEDLKLTANTQPALMTVSLAVVRALETIAQRPLRDIVDVAAGHSLGEFSALAAMNALEIADAARLLRLRGEAMQEAVPEGKGAMAAIMGLDHEKVLATIKEAEQGSVCDIANDNGSGQIVISGSKEAVERAIAIAKKNGAKRAVPLSVSAPFHCRLMVPAAEKLSAALETTRFHAPDKPIVANVTAEPVTDEGMFPDLLTRQVTGTVRWRETMDWMAENGVSTIIECGAGNVLTGLAKRGMKGASRVNLLEPQDINNFCETLSA